MQIIVPMSGTGRRFLDAGYADPKPLIEVDGNPIINYVVKLFPGENNFIFICNENHLKTTNISDVLSSLVPAAKIVSIPQHKLGPVYAVMQAADSISDDEPTIVNYCDFYACWDYADFKQKMIDLDCDGAIPCYKHFHPHLLLPGFYAGVRADENNFMIEIREKHSFTENKMDTFQSSGTYYFKSGRIVKHYFQKIMDQKNSLNGEYYVSMVYNYLQEDGLKTYVYEFPYFCQWGTPLDLEIYKSWSNYFANLVS